MDATEAEAAQILRRKLQVYSTRPYRFITVNCAENHFVVISLTFDLEKRNQFKDVVVYDSIRKSGRKPAAH